MVEHRPSALRWERELIGGRIPGPRPVSDRPDLEAHPLRHQLKRPEVVAGGQHAVVGGAGVAESLQGLGAGPEEKRNIPLGPSIASCREPMISPRPPPAPSPLGARYRRHAQQGGRPGGEGEHDGGARTLLTHVVVLG